MWQVPVSMYSKFQTTKPLIEPVTTEIDADYAFSSRSFRESDVPARLLLEAFAPTLVEDVFFLNAVGPVSELSSHVECDYVS